ncbi:MAG: hypothetical protein KBD27_02290 [Candidatus Moranbacteria bacterium]|nr:hypothetical protein [Candidatus Moranbacteria bacterium]
MTTKQFGKVVAFLVAIFMVFGIAIGVVSKMMTPAINPPVVMMEEKTENDTLAGRRLYTTVIEMSDFSDTKRGISFSYPKAFYQQKSTDGKYAYQVYFTSSDIRDDFRSLGDDQVQLTVTVFKKGWMDGKDVQELAKQGVARIEEESSVMVDGVSAMQERVLVLTEDPGCDVRTYFTKAGVSYELSLFSPGKNCETVQGFMTEYTAALSSFRTGQ